MLKYGLVAVEDGMTLEAASKDRIRGLGDFVTRVSLAGLSLVGASAGRVIVNDVRLVDLAADRRRS